MRQNLLLSRSRASFHALCLPTDMLVSWLLALALMLQQLYKKQVHQLPIFHTPPRVPTESALRGILLEQCHRALSSWKYHLPKKACIKHLSARGGVLSSVSSESHCHRLCPLGKSLESLAEAVKPSWAKHKGIRREEHFKKSPQGHCVASGVHSSPPIPHFHSSFTPFIFPLL